MLESLFNKVVPALLFSCEYYEIFKNTYFEEYLRAAASECRSGQIARLMPNFRAHKFCLVKKKNFNQKFQISNQKDKTIKNPNTIVSTSMLVIILSLHIS